MLATALGIDTTTAGGMWSLAVFATAACILVGFLTDNILGKAGFGIIGNGFIVMFGVVMTAYIIDWRMAGLPVASTNGVLVLAGACGTALLMLMAAIRQRSD